MQSAILGDSARREGTIVYLTDKPPVEPEMFAGYPDLLTTAHVAEILSQSEASIRNLIRAGELPAVKVGQRWYTPKNKLIAMIG